MDRQEVVARLEKDVGKIVMVRTKDWCQFPALNAGHGQIPNDSNFCFIVERVEGAVPGTDDFRGTYVSPSSIKSFKDCKQYSTCYEVNFDRRHFHSETLISNPEKIWEARSL
ncbi:MAG: hypothetical protein KJ592_03380 [Nanoarchaeota archaeon]|nr:hypothetical protein [Nanoarchaeota archaeon]